MAKYKKTSQKQDETGRFFFTATPELTDWIVKEASNLGITAPVFIRMKMFEVMKNDQ